LAKAGHLASFLNQDNMSFPNALPLGPDPDENNESTAFRLAVGDSLTFCTDGLLEAPDAEGEIFSFDRVLVRNLAAIQRAGQTLLSRLPHRNDGPSDWYRDVG
jgi:serine phosphatase RsbU (regulator of sigma subunit)